MTPLNLRNNLLRAAKIAARNHFLQAWILQYMSFTLPVERQVEITTLLAFRHPISA
jgi:hypothetical protein